MKLLIVDDSLVVRDAIQRSVDRGTISEVFRAEDGEVAVSTFAREVAALVRTPSPESSAEPPPRHR